MPHVQQVVLLGRLVLPPGLCASEAASGEKDLARRVASGVSELWLTRRQPPVAEVARAYVRLQARCQPNLVQAEGLCALAPREMCHATMGVSS